VNPGRLITSLESFLEVLPPVLAGVTADDARRRGPDDAWSILEIVTHLADEEVEDFRARVRSTLDDPAAAWTPIAPEEWAGERRYNDGDLAETLERFLEARRESVAWLRGLGDVDWTRAYEHPRFGPISAGDVLVSWAAHDVLHLRQLAKRRYEQIARDGAPHSTAYAGPW
jgi:hypothetical protein